jgi:hypothetical protein
VKIDTGQATLEPFQTKTAVIYPVWMAVEVEVEVEVEVATTMQLV